MRLLITSALAVVAFSGPLQAQYEDCKYEAERATTVEADGARLLQIDAGSGFLKIQGKPGSKSVVIRGRACASDKDLLDDIKLDARREGSTVAVKANVHDGNSYNNSFRSHEYARLDVTIEVPAGMDANIDDGSGEMELGGLGAVDIDDGSGGIVASNLGSVHIDDGSGEIDLTDIHGKVDIQDGSGEITLRRVDGLVEIDDGSGEIDVRDAKTTVRISDSSGSISVADVGGDFIVEHDGSGGIDYDNVRGKVDIPRRRR